MIIYKSLNFLGYPRYKVDNLGNVWSDNLTKLTVEQTQDIIDRVLQGKMTSSQAAAKYGVSFKTIRNIINCKTRARYIKLKPGIGRHGYWHVSLYAIDGKQKTFPIHKLICWAFHGAKKIGQQVRHLNGDIYDNSANNLCWGTAKEDAQDRERNGNTLRGVKHWASKRSKLVDNDIVEIRRLYATGEYYLKDIANIYNVSLQNIHYIVTGKYWSHV